MKARDLKVGQIYVYENKHMTGRNYGNPWPPKPQQVITVFIPLKLYKKPDSMMVAECQVLTGTGPFIDDDNSHPLNWEDLKYVRPISSKELPLFFGLPYVSKEFERRISKGA
jgi:hypothetical protein